MPLSENLLKPLCNCRSGSPAMQHCPSRHRSWQEIVCKSHTAPDQSRNFRAGLGEDSMANGRARREEAPRPPTQMAQKSTPGRLGWVYRPCGVGESLSGNHVHQASDSEFCPAVMLQSDCVTQKIFDNGKIVRVCPYDHKDCLSLRRQNELEKDVTVVSCATTVRESRCRERIVRSRYVIRGGVVTYPQKRRAVTRCRFGASRDHPHCRTRGKG